MQAVTVYFRGKTISRKKKSLAETEWTNSGVNLFGIIKYREDYFKEVVANSNNNSLEDIVTK